MAIPKLKRNHWYILLVLKHLDNQYKEPVGILRLLARLNTLYKSVFKDLCYTSVTDGLAHLKSLGFVVSSAIDKDRYLSGPHVRWQITRDGKAHLKNTISFFGKPKKKYLAKEL